MTGSRVRSFEELTMGAGPTLEELVDRDSLEELVTSFFELFRMPIKVYDTSAGLVAGLRAEEAPYAYLNQFPHTRRELAGVVAEVKAARPESGIDCDVTCVTGARYHIADISHDGRSIGRLVLGPFLLPDWSGIPEALLGLEPTLDGEQLFALMRRLPKVQAKTVAQISRHLKRSLDIMLFSGHKALLASSMHLASVRESYRQLEEKNRGLERAFEQLREVDRLKSNLLATVSHELRTPLTSIIGYSEMLKEGIAGTITSEQLDFVSTIHEKGRQLLELISGLLDLSKMESGTLTLRRAPVEFAPIVRDVLQTLAPMARAKGVQLTGECESSLPPVLGDADRLRQVLLNLADNALKFTPAGGCIAIRVRMTTVDPVPQDDSGVVLLAARQSAAELSVSDTGLGVPDIEKRRIFEPFYQVDSGSTRVAGGTGLGLSIVKRLVEGHQGTIYVEDNLPCGAKMVVVIPMKQLTVA